MNDYIDYYDYMYNLNNYQNKDKNKNVKKANTFTDPYEGFIKGNMFEKLYSQYKNYKPKELNPQNNKEYLQLLVQIYGFAAHDIGLYLDVNPNDQNAIQKRNEYINMYKQTLLEYENNYGPIRTTSALLDKSPWAWDTKKWPWEENE